MNKCEFCRYNDSDGCYFDVERDNLDPDDKRFTYFDGYSTRFHEEDFREAKENLIYNKHCACQDAIEDFRDYLRERRGDTSTTNININDDDDYR